MAGESLPTEGNALRRSGANLDRVVRPIAIKPLVPVVTPDGCNSAEQHTIVTA
jgi:hypothetical protein